MSYYIHINGKAVREYKSYNAAVNNAIAKARPGRDIYLTRDGDVVPVLKVGDMAMSQNVMLKVVGIHAAGVDLQGEFGGITIKQMGVDPSTLRLPGSEESQIYYWEQMDAKLDAEKPSKDLCKKIIAALEPQRNADPQTPTEEEENCRVDAFICAIEQYMSR
jgi:hypothetical protein